jgi:hypothetical protein
MAALAGFTAAPAYAQTPETPRAFLLFVDDLHLEFRQTPRTRALMQRVLREAAREGDLWAVVTTGTSSLSLAPTKDLEVLRGTVARVTGNGLKPSERMPVEPGSGAALEVKHRAEVSYATATQAIEGLAAAAPGAMLTVLYISDGYDTRLAAGPRALIDAATRVRATVFAIKPVPQAVVPADIPPAEWAAYVAATQGALQMLATETGGIAALGPDDIDLLLQRVAAAR